VVTLLLGLAERDPAAYEGATGPLLVWLTRLAVRRQVSEDYGLLTGRRAHGCR